MPSTSCSKGPNVLVPSPYRFRMTKALDVLGPPMHALSKSLGWIDSVGFIYEERESLTFNR